MNFRSAVLLLAVGAAFPANTFAQLPDSKVLTLEVAQEIVQEAVAKCRAGGSKVSALVVDALNAPKALLRDDGASAATTEMARMKATTVMKYNRASGPPPNLPAGAPAPTPAVPGTTSLTGGLPIKVGGVTIGAVAVSGGDDVTCANAGLAKVADKLK